MMEQIIDALVAEIERLAGLCNSLQQQLVAFKVNMQSKEQKDELAQAVARAWGHPENAEKPLDPALIGAIVKEILGGE